MAGGRFGQVNVGLQADAFEVAHLFGRHDVVQIFGHRVRVEAHASADDLRGAKAETADRIPGLVHQIFSEFARGDFLREFFLVDWVENIVQISKQCAKCEAHESYPISQVPSRILENS